MQRLSYFFMLALVVIMIGYSIRMKEERLQVEQFLWLEFDAAFTGLIRMLYLAESSPHAARPSLLAAYEHGMALRRLAPVAERLLSWHGVKAEPLAGYIFSLTGGVASVCEQAQQHGIADTLWIAEIRDRLEVIHAALNADTMREPNQKQLQRSIESLFGFETALFFSIPVDATSDCFAL